MDARTGSISRGVSDASEQGSVFIQFSHGNGIVSANHPFRTPARRVRAALSKKPPAAPGAGAQQVSPKEAR